MDGDRESGPVALDKQVQTGDSQGQQNRLPANTDSRRCLAVGTSHLANTPLFSALSLFLDSIGVLLNEL